MEMLSSCPVPLLASQVCTDLEISDHQILLQQVGKRVEQLLSHQQLCYTTVRIA